MLKECEKCKRLNSKLGIENVREYEAICDKCWDKRIDKLEKARDDN